LKFRIVPSIAARKSSAEPISFIAIDDALLVLFDVVKILRRDS
jgi:hypothetical protein